MLCWPYARIALQMTILLAHNPMVSVRALKGGCHWKNQLFRVRDRPPVVPLYVDAPALQVQVLIAKGDGGSFKKFFKLIPVVRRLIIRGSIPLLHPCNGCGVLVLTLCIGVVSAKL